MAGGEASITVIPGHALDDEIEQMLDSVQRARRNRWYDGDVIDATFEPVLAAVTNRAPLDYAAGLGLEAGRGPRPNRWQEAHTVATGVTERS